MAAVAGRGHRPVRPATEQAARPVTVAFLASDAAAALTGQTLCTDGGLILRLAGRHIQERGRSGKHLLRIHHDVALGDLRLTLGDLRFLRRYGLSGASCCPKVIHMLPSWVNRTPPKMWAIFVLMFIVVFIAFYIGYH